MARVRETREPEDERAETPQPAAPTHVDAILKLQAQAGNRATSRLIARAPDPAAPEAAPRERSGYVMTVEGFGSYEAQSFQTTGKTAILVSFDPGKDAARLMSASQQGEPIKAVTITAGSRTIRLTDVLITSFQYAADAAAGDPTLVSVGFDGKSLDFE